MSEDEVGLGQGERALTIRQKGRRRGDTQGDGRGETEAESAVMQPPAKEPPEVGRGRKEPPLELLEALGHLAFRPLASMPGRA